MSLLALRERLRRQRSDEGIALIELVVSMVVTLIMLTLIARMFAQVTHAAGDNQSSRAGVGVAGTAMDEITRVVRQGARVSTSATGFEGAVIAGSTGATLSIDSYVDAAITGGQATLAPTRVVFSVNSSSMLQEDRYAGTVANGYVSFSTAAVTRIVNGPLMTTGAPLFAYADRTGAAVVPASGGLTQTQALSVASVIVTVSVRNTLSSGDDPVQLVNQVTMPNIAITNGGY